MCLSRYRGDFQVVADVHSVHIFLRDRVGTVQISQQACWLRAHKTKLNGQRLKKKTLPQLSALAYVLEYFACITIIVLIASALNILDRHQIFV